MLQPKVFVKQYNKIFNVVNYCYDKKILTINNNGKVVKEIIRLETVGVFSKNEVVEEYNELIREYTSQGWNAEIIRIIEVDVLDKKIITLLERDVKDEETQTQ